jgi:hypothetical protein
MKDKLDALRKLIRETFPAHHKRIGIHIFESFDGTGKDVLDITFYECASYAEGSNMLRSLGIGVREKQILSEESSAPWVNVKGKLGDDEFSAYCTGLPPSCKKVTFIEKIPKTQTVDTGEFVEVERVKVVCGNENEVAK